MGLQWASARDGGGEWVCSGQVRAAEGASGSAVGMFVRRRGRVGLQCGSAISFSSCSRRGDRNLRALLGTGLQVLHRRSLLVEQRSEGPAVGLDLGEARLLAEIILNALVDA